MCLVGAFLVGAFLVGPFVGKYFQMLLPTRVNILVEMDFSGLFISSSFGFSPVRF